MKLEEKYLVKCYYNAMIFQYMDMLRNEGFHVYHKLKYKYGDSFIEIDLFAEKYKEKRIYKFKYIGNYHEYKDIQDISEFKKFAKEIKARSFIVYVNIPHEKQIEYDDLEEKIINYFISNGIPNELDILSTHTSIDSIDIDEINSIRVKSNGYIELEGNGIVYVDLQYGSDYDNRNGDGLGIQDSFPIEYKIKFNSEQKILDIDCKIDTSSFYEYLSYD